MTYYKIRKEPFFVDEPCDECGKYGSKAIIETVVKWDKNTPRAFHIVKCNHCGLQQNSLHWNLEPVESEQES